MKILELIIAALGKQGIDKKYAERVQKLFKIEKEEGIDDFVTLFKDNVLPAVVEAETAAKTAAEATAKVAAITEYETTHKLKDGKSIEVEDPSKKLPDTMDAATKAIFDAQNKKIDELIGLVGGVVKTQTGATKLQSVKAKLKGQIDEKYLEKIAGKINLDAEDLDAEILAQVSEFNEFKQSLIADMVGSDYVPPVGDPAKGKTVEEYQKLMDSSTASTVGTVDLGLGK